MATKCGVGYSNEADAKKAGELAAKAALSQAGITDKPDFAMIFTTSRHDPKKFHSGVREVIGPNAKLAGGWMAGVITKDRHTYEGGETMVVAFKSDTVKFDVFMETGLVEHEKDVGKRLGAKMKAHKFEGEPKVFLFFDAVARSLSEGGWGWNFASPLLAGLKESLGTWPVMAGAGLIGDMQFNPTWQWCNDELVQGAAIAVVFHGRVHMDTMTLHGCSPSSTYLKLTKVEGPTILEINNRPALDVIREMLGDASRTWEDYPLYLTLGLNRGDKYADFNEEAYMNRVGMAIDRERKAVVLVEGDFKEGDEVQVMSRSIDPEYMKPKLEAFGKRMDRTKPFLTFYIDCGARAAAFNPGTTFEDASLVQKALGTKAPLAGIYVGIEIAPIGGQIERSVYTGVLSSLSD